MQEKSVSCRGINGSIILSKDKMTVIGVGLGPPEPHDICFSDVSSVVVERKSVVPFTTVMILAIIVLLIVKYNSLWFIVDLTGVGRFIAPIALAVAMLCAFASAIRLMFVNVNVRWGHNLLTMRLVSNRSAKRLARHFSEISAGS
jgi:hypothetical protein